MAGKPERFERLTAGTDSPFALIEIGWLAEGSTPEGPIVDFAGNTLGPLPARSAVVFSPATLREAVRSEQSVVLQFEQGRVELPIIIGLLRPKETTLVELLLSGEPVASQVETPAAQADAQGATGVDAPAAASTERPHLEARHEGNRTIIEAPEQLVLRCGRSSLSLSSDGRVIVRGVRIETCAEGVNRIKGGAVKIN